MERNFDQPVEVIFVAHVTNSLDQKNSDKPGQSVKAFADSVELVAFFPAAEGYGIPGTPNPSKIGKSESHGCVRMNNWDVALLGKNVKKGTPVTFVVSSQVDKKG
jgi:lipoprotein-anchoring transpeptidase ErfK/SrfK